MGAPSFGKSAIGEVRVADSEGSNGKSMKTRILHWASSAVAGKMKRDGSSESGSGLSVQSLEGEEGKKKLDILKRVIAPKRSP